MALFKRGSSLFWNTLNAYDYKSFKYKAKLLQNIVDQPANAANGLLKDAAIAVPLNYLSNFWRLLEMPLINSKVELKLKLTKYCIKSIAGADNVNTVDFVLL